MAISLSWITHVVSCVICSTPLFFSPHGLIPQSLSVARTRIIWLATICSRQVPLILLSCCNYSKTYTRDDIAARWCVRISTLALLSQRCSLEGYIHLVGLTDSTGLHYLLPGHSTTCWSSPCLSSIHSGPKPAFISTFKLATSWVVYQSGCTRTHPLRLLRVGTHT